jgi:hypothetical protein
MRLLHPSRGLGFILGSPRPMDRMGYLLYIRIWFASGDSPVGWAGPPGSKWGVKPFQSKSNLCRYHPHTTDPHREDFNA